MTDHPVQNTDREIWRGPDKGNGSFYADSLHVTKEGGIGINCGGHVIVMTPRNWHRIGREYLKGLESPFAPGSYGAAPPFPNGDRQTHD